VEKYCKAGQATDDYGPCALNARYLRPHTHTHTHTEYVILIAFLLQQWLQERASVRILPVLLTFRFDCDN